MQTFARLAPAALRTEYRINPLGLDEPQPRLSWELRATSDHARRVRQSAYHIRVSGDPAAGASAPADLWDSGEVPSDQTAHVEYNGKKLASRQVCIWRVRVRDERNQWSPWSEPATWSMGLLDASDWTAQWIGTGESFSPLISPQVDVAPPPDNTMADPWFRRPFQLPARPRRATAHVASIGYHELFVNGRKAGDSVLMPSVSDQSQRARYVSYEIADLLHAGENVIGLWLGTGWSIFPTIATPDKPRAPIVLGQFDFDLPDGTRQRVVTDPTWKTHPSPGTLLGIWYFMNFGGELYDANREVAGWSEPGLDERGWKPAKAFSPQLVLSAERVEPNRRLTELTPVALEQTADGDYRADLGRNFAGMTEIAVQGRPGDRIEFYFSERPDRLVTHRMRNVYIIGPAGKGVFQNRFNYSAGRWLTIRGLRRMPAAADIRGWQVRNDFTPAAAFACSQPLLEEIYATTRWTLENLSLGGYTVDCPHRERIGYGGDGQASITTALNLFAMGAFYSKWAEDWRDVEGRAPIWGHERAPTEAGGGAREGGSLPYAAPMNWGGGGPAWSGFSIQLPWEVYRQYGDRRILRLTFPMMRRWLGFLETKAKDNLLRRWGGEWDFLGDWLWPDACEVNGDTEETLFFNNCYWIYSLQTAANMAAVLGEEKSAADWRRRAEEIRGAVHRAFFHPHDGSYVNGSQAYQAIALLAGVPPEEMRARVWGRLAHEILHVRHGHIHSGITGGAILFRTLMGAQRDDLIHAMVGKEDAPGWGHMLREGATTIWEAWNSHERHSLLHSSFLYVGAWFIHGVLGIQPDESQPGFRRFVIRPGVIDRPELTWAGGHYDSIRGRILSSWKRTNDAFELTVEVPPNTTARVHIPAVSQEQIQVDGRLLEEDPDVRVVTTTVDRVVLDVDSGRYVFRSVPAHTTVPAVAPSA